MVGWGDDENVPSPRALKEAENGYTQARWLRARIAAEVSPPKRWFMLVPADLCELNRLAVDGLSATAGRLRERSDLEIDGSRHELPDHRFVPSLVGHLCAFVNERQDEDPLFLAAYVLWRICWVHPFEDGNGRTARAASYFVLSVRLGTELSGSRPIPRRLQNSPIYYRRALEAADAAWARGELDVSEMRRLLEFYLDAQVREKDPAILPDW